METTSFSRKGGGGGGGGGRGREEPCTICNVLHGRLRKQKNEKQNRDSNPKKQCSCRLSSLRTADVFPVVASLPPKNGREATTGNTSAVRRLQVIRVQ